MTKQKKFKRRVRARMKETGERYTEAATELENLNGPSLPAAETIAAWDLTEAARAIASLRMSPYGIEERVIALVREYHRHCMPRGQGSWILLAGEVVNVLWSRNAEIVSLSELARRVGEVLDRWHRGGEAPQGGRVLPFPRPINRTAPTHSIKVEEVSEGSEDAGRNTWDGGEIGLVPSSVDSPDEPIDTRVQLEDIWDYAPDVRSAFFGGGEHVLDEATAADLARQFRRMADQAERMIEQTRLPGTHLKEAIPRPPMATEQIQIGDHTYPAVHGGAADELIRYAQEIARLREKLSEAGIDPDA